MNQATMNDGGRHAAGGCGLARRKVQALRWLAVCLAAAIISACGGGAATQDTPAPVPVPVPDPGPGPAAAAFTLMPERLGLAIGGEGRLLALAPPGTLVWSSSDPALASVDTQGQVKALAEGSVTITARSGTSSSSAAVKVYAATAASGSALIDTALAQKRISAEQALMYQVFALLGDERLPAEFQGAPGAGPHHLLLRDLMTTVGSLSAATQDVLRPFLVPPIYADSWFAKRLGIKAQAQALQAKPANKTRLSTVNCAVSITPSLYAHVSTAHFNI